MFTGLIEEVGLLKSLTNNEIKITCNKILSDIKIGDSISINGVCLSVTNIDNNILTFHISPTTRNISCFKTGEIRIGDKINLERALTPSSRIAGHIVSGHIDGKIKIINIEKQNEDVFFEFLFPKEIKTLIIPKGSVAIDGISLTISEVLTSSFVVTVIPQTLNDTNLKNKHIGNFVHIEADIFARYIKHVLSTGGNNEKNNRIAEMFF